MYALKAISHDTVSGALAKAERYRLLNEPGEAESICRDILAVEPDHQQAIVSLILALTDEIPHDTHAFRNATGMVDQLHSPYERAYYCGIAWERRAKARHHAGGQGAHHYAYDWIVKALDCFGEAESLKPAGNDDAVLRWNACVRFLMQHKELVPRQEEVAEPIVSE